MTCIRCKSCGVTPGKSWDLSWNHEQDLCPDCTSLHKKGTILDCFAAEHIFFVITSPQPLIRVFLCVAQIVDKLHCCSNSWHHMTNLLFVFQSGNFCTICQLCYGDRSQHSQMIQCLKCRHWIHYVCEGLSGVAPWSVFFALNLTSLTFIPNSPTLIMSFVTVEDLCGLLSSQTKATVFTCSPCSQHLIGYSSLKEQLQSRMNALLGEVFTDLLSNDNTKHLSICKMVRNTYSWV